MHHLAWYPMPISGAHSVGWHLCIAGGRLTIYLRLERWVSAVPIINSYNNSWLLFPHQAYIVLQCVHQSAVIYHNLPISRKWRIRITIPWNQVEGFPRQCALQCRTPQPNRACNELGSWVKGTTQTWTCMAWKFWTNVLNYIKILGRCNMTL